ncbi:MAG: hypothetical protein M3032_09780 [Verrucomicrobiota bacterium]|nr:hypothetical protein [Verrucomicrobiota bacterium]
MILIAGIAAHAGCLHSIFYLDDWWQIRDSEFVEGGQWWGEPTLLLTHLSYYLTWKLAGFSSVAFHAGNLALHLLLALCVYWLGRSFLPRAEKSEWLRRDTVAWVAALIFAVHPLTTEITNYARARDHGLVALFSFLTAGFTALALRGSWRWAAAAVAAILAATFSKGPGFAHAALSCGLVALAFASREDWRGRFSRRSTKVTATLIGLLVLTVAFPVLRHLGRALAAEASLKPFLLHALTQSRVLPEYLWRMALPLQLCSDHLVALTKSFADITAWICAVGVIGLVAFDVLLWTRRRQPFALLLALALGPLLLRFLYNISELMVEYRVYPALPFVALLFAMPLCYLGSKMPRLGFVAIAVVLVSFIALSEQRSTEWRSAETLYAQIERLYPMQLRVLNCRSADDLRAERFEPVIQRHAEFNQRLEQVLAFNRASPTRVYENWISWLVAEQCMYVDALAKARSPALARAQLEVTARGMKTLQIVNPALWSAWEVTAAHLDLVEGKLDSAKDHFLAARPHWQKFPIDRELRAIDPTYLPTQP